jgi:hypothetical protein
MASCQWLKKMFNKFNPYVRCDSILVRKNQIGLIKFIMFFYKFNLYRNFIYGHLSVCLFHHFHSEEEEEYHPSWVMANTTKKQRDTKRKEKEKKNKFHVKDTWMCSVSQIEFELDFSRHRCNNLFRQIDR